MVDPEETARQSLIQDEREHGVSRAAEISRGIVGLVSRYTGRGPTKARTTLNTNIVVVVLKDTLTKGEQNLVGASEVEAVTMMRRRYSAAMRKEAVELVERVTGRTVESALSDVDPFKNVGVEVFILARAPDTGIASTAEVSIGPDSADP